MQIIMNLDRITSKKKPLTFIIITCLIIFFGCGKKLPTDKDFSDKHFTFLNQDSAKVTFPDIVKSRVSILALIFTNCPDICPMITNNMQFIEKKLKKENVPMIDFVLISFDPSRDKPSIMKQYAELRGMTTKNWHLLTGSQKGIDSLRTILNYVVIPGDTSYSEQKTPYYFFTHTDKIFLMDGESKIRKSYRGSVVNLNEITEDIIALKGG